MYTTTLLQGNVQVVQCTLQHWYKCSGCTMYTTLLHWYKCSGWTMHTTTLVKDSVQVVWYTTTLVQVCSGNTMYITTLLQDSVQVVQCTLLHLYKTVFRLYTAH